MISLAYICLFTPSPCILSRVLVHAGQQHPPNGENDAELSLKNANVVLDGHANLQSFLHVLVKDHRIETVTRDPIECPDATLIYVRGQTV